MNKINLGCGDDYREGWTNVDFAERFRPDDSGEGEFIMHDLSETPWPFDDDEFDYALIDNVFEHIEPSERPAFVDEARRILSDDAKLVMRLPTHAGWDITHYSVPPWYWPYHPRHNDWTLESVEVTKTTLGRLLPQKVVLMALKYDIGWVAQQVELHLR